MKEINNFGFYHPEKYFLVAGTGDSEYDLVAFDQALINAGIADVNLSTITSIIAPHCKRIDPIPLVAGGIYAVAFASIQSNKAGEIISSAVAVSQPDDKSKAGLIMELSDRLPKDLVEKKVKEMASMGMKNRDIHLFSIETISVEHIVKNVGCTFAGVVEL